MNNDQKLDKMNLWIAHYRSLLYAREQHASLCDNDSPGRHAILQDALIKEEARFAERAPELPEDLQAALKAFLG